MCECNSIYEKTIANSEDLVEFISLKIKENESQIILNTNIAEAGVKSSSDYRRRNSNEEVSITLKIIKNNIYKALLVSKLEKIKQRIKEESFQDFNLLRDEVVIFYWKVIKTNETKNLIQETKELNRKLNERSCR